MIELGEEEKGVEREPIRKEQQQNWEEENGGIQFNERKDIWTYDYLTISLPFHFLLCLIKLSTFFCCFQTKSIT